MRMYVMIKDGIVTMSELKEVYTLDEALKLYAIYKMNKDIERAKYDEMDKKNKK